MKRKIIFFGCTKFSEEILNYLLKKGIIVKAIFSIPNEFSISYSNKKVKNYNYADLSKIATNNGIKYIEIKTEEGERISNHYDLIKKISPDVILVSGWYYMIPEKILSLPKEGVWGLHASLLPNYAGGAPLVWAMINNEDFTGVTLFKMKKGVDNGDIIGQRIFRINNIDTIDKLVKKSAEASKRLLNKFLNQKEIKYINQLESEIKIYPQRSPKDGEIDWSKSPEYIERFIRAQTKPYPGAWTLIDGKKITIWDAKIERND